MTEHVKVTVKNVPLWTVISIIWQRCDICCDSHAVYKCLDLCTHKNSLHWQ